jgi:hypothetical protein
MTSVNGRLCREPPCEGRAGSSLRLPGVVHDGQPGVPLELDAEASVGTEASVGAVFEL